MKRIFLILVLVCLVIAACKKGGEGVTENIDTTEDINVIGRYSVTYYSDTDSLHTYTHSYDSKDIPCMENNKITLNADGSITADYIGKDICYLYYKDQFNNTSLGLDTVTKISTWKKNGNDLIYKIVFPKRITNKELVRTFKITTVNGRARISSTNISSSGHGDYYTEYTIAYTKDPE